MGDFNIFFFGFSIMGLVVAVAVGSRLATILFTASLAANIASVLL